MSANSPYTPQGKPTAVPGVNFDGLQLGFLGMPNLLQYTIREEGNPADGATFYIEQTDPSDEAIRAAKEKKEREFREQSL